MKMVTILLPVIVAALASCTSGGSVYMGSGERWWILLGKQHARRV